METLVPPEASTLEAAAAPDAVKPYQPDEFWESRLRARFDLTGVGYRGIGKPFNEFLYRQRRIVLGRMLAATGIAGRGATVVELGPGTGYWVAFWKGLGARRLVGLDITTVATDRLAEAFPEFEFARADISEPWPVEDASADIVTAFDVLFHITDDDRFQAAIGQAARVLRPGGHLFITDLFPHGSSFRGYHQASRTLREYEATLDAAGFDIVRRRPVFVTMHPAIDVPRWLAPIATRWWGWIERRLVAEPRRGRRMGRILGPIDRVLTKVFPGGPSTEMLVARRRAARER